RVIVSPYLRTICVQIVLFLVCFLMLLPPQMSTLFPYTTLFRSVLDAVEDRIDFHGGQLSRASCRTRLPADRAGGTPGSTGHGTGDRKSTRLNSSHVKISYAVFCLKKKKSICKNIR